MMTGNELIAYTRQLIHESDPDFWNASTLLVTLNAAQKRLVMKMQRAAERIFYTSCTIPLVAGTDSYKLPDGTLYSAASKCLGKIDMMFLPGYPPLRKCDFNRFYNVTDTGTPKYIALVGDYIYLRPIPESAANYTLRYPYFPAAITAADTAIDFIEGFEPMIALEAARISMMKEEADLTDLRKELEDYWEDFKRTYCGNRIEGQPDEPIMSIHETEDL